LTVRRLEVLQWVGLVAGAAVWAAAHVVGFGITQADCGRASSGWGIELDLWEGLATGTAAALALGAALAAVGVIVATSDSSYEAPPPVGRMRFFAIAALAANVIFLAMIALYALGSIAGVPCRQA
jgi:hypothetical protein